MKELDGDKQMMVKLYVYDVICNLSFLAQKVRVFNRIFVILSNVRMVNGGEQRRWNDGWLLSDIIPTSSPCVQWQR